MSTVNNSQQNTSQWNSIVECKHTDTLMMNYFTNPVGLLMTVVVFFVTRVLWILLFEIRPQRRPRQGAFIAGSSSSSKPRTRPVKTLIVLGSGGHTTEMLYLTQFLNPAQYHPILYCKADTDTTSALRLSLPLQQAPKAAAAAAAGGQQQQQQIWNIPRSREVGQSYWTSIFTTFYAFGLALYWQVRIRPDLILCNGPGTCLPVCVAGFLWRIISFGGGFSSFRGGNSNTSSSSPKLVFVESYCRVQTLSLTGKLLYPFVDVFCLHWPELQLKYPQSCLLTTFIKTTSR